MKTSRRDIWLMLIPVLILAGVGIAIRNRQGPRLLVGPNESRLTIESVRHESLTPREVFDGYDTKIAVELGYRGSAPAWWGKQGVSSGTNAGQWRLFQSSETGLRPVKLKSGFEPEIMRWHPSYDTAKGVYVTRYLTRLATARDRGEVRLRDRVAVLDVNRKPLCKPVWLDAKVREAGQDTAIPRVSKDPGFELVRYEVDEAPTIETNGRGPAWQVRFFSRITGPDSAKRSVFADSELHDARGKIFASMGHSGPVDEPLGSTRRDARAHIQGYYNNLALDPTSRLPAGPLWIVSKVYSGDKWPRQMRIPFRNSNGNFLLSPRSLPQFHVVESSVAPATADNTKELGADTTVTFIIQPMGTPTKPLDKWQWQAAHSQHVQDITGKSYWLFPFIGIPPQPAIPEYGFTDGAKSEMEISYHLNLSKIPSSAGRLTFKAEVSANGSRRVPVSVVVRS